MRNNVAKVGIGSCNMGFFETNVPGVGQFYADTKWVKLH